MLKTRTLIPRLALAAAALGVLIPASAQTLNYPQTRKGEQVDDYHGVKVADPYRWLEDDRSAETLSLIHI